VPDQKVYWFVRSNEKVERLQSPGDAGDLQRRHQPTSVGSPRSGRPPPQTAKTMSTICLTSVHGTACTPPNIV
jgi:hypothetical protein